VVAKKKSPRAAKSVEVREEKNSVSVEKSTSSNSHDRELELIKELNKGNDGAPAQLLGSDALAIKIRGVISTQCPTLDGAIGRGGIPLGRITLIHGKESCGKTTVAMHCVAETQRKGGLAVYADAEHKLDPDYARRIGVDLDKLIVAQTEYLERFFALIEKTIDVSRRYRQAGEDFPVLVVLDSINAMPSKAEFESGWEAQTMGSTAKAYSDKLKLLAPMISAENVALLLISQEREKIGVMYGRKEQTGGGKAPRYYSSLILEVVRTGSIMGKRAKGEEKEKDPDVIGNETRVKCVKNQIAPPFRVADFNILYGSGIDFEDALITEACRLEKVSKAGGYFDYSGQRYHGQQNFADAIRSDPSLKGRLDKEVKGEL
jgi:recombination protein RecA